LELTSVVTGATEAEAEFATESDLHVLETFTFFSLTETEEEETAVSKLFFTTGAGTEEAVGSGTEVFEVFFLAILLYYT
jgi:hypothetical protein